MFLYPPLWPEGLPTSILEAGLMSCAVIGTNQGGITEIIKDQLNQMYDGDFSEEDIESAKQLIYASFKSIPDAQDSELTYYFAQQLSEKFVSLDENIEKMRDECKNIRNLALIELLISTGIRVGELVNLDIKDINFEDRSCIVQGKGNKQREVYFDEVKDFAECGLCGTAAVISPVGKVVDHGKEICFPSGMDEMGPITKKLYDTLTGIQMGRIEAPEGWIKTIL